MLDWHAVSAAASAAVAAARGSGLRCLVVSYSGGVDSHVLLHAMRSSLCEHGDGIDLRALHIDHQLQAHSSTWRQHCADICQRLAVPFTAIEVDAAGAPGQSPEEAARNARYRAIARQLRSTDAILTAHHRDDQAETVLLQLLRGSGTAGLAAMPARRAMGAGVHLRPLLELPRSSLTDYVRVHGLHWVEDPSNYCDRYPRNYLRHSLWPLLTSRWPSASATLARVAQNSAEASALNATLATIDSESVIDASGAVKLVALARLEPLRQRNVLRHWLHKAAGWFPSRANLQELYTTVIEARIDAQPLLKFASLSIRRYRGFLHAVPPLPPLPADWSMHWADTRRALPIADLGIVLPVSMLGVIEPARRVSESVQVRLRRSGESLRLPGRPRKSLKALLRESGVPPWRRHRLPLIYVGDELVAVYGVTGN